MKKITNLLLCMFFVGQAHAEIAFVNENTINDIEVTYKFCDFPGNGDDTTCTGMKTIAVKSDNNNHVYKVSNYPKTANILIVSAVEKDRSGKVVAQGKYEGDIGFSDCGLPLDGGVVPNNILFSFSDMRGTSIIRCIGGNY